VKEAVHIPVIGNGDVTTPFLAKRMLEETGCDGVMIGRGALGNPWIFSQKKIFLEEGSTIQPSFEQRRKVIERHFLLLRSHYGDGGAMKKIRRHIAWYTKGLPHSASFRSTLSGVKEEEALFEAVKSYFDRIERRGPCPSFVSRESRSATG
jgi:tRNA-dihydrouridine synthase